MLPSLGFQEILLLGILALVVVGPKDLPLMLRKLGRFTAKLRGMAQEFRTGFDELARQAELDELKKEVDALRRNSVLSDIKSEISKPLPAIDTSVTPIPPAPAVAELPAPHDVTHAALAPETPENAASAEVANEDVYPPVEPNEEIEAVEDQRAIKMAEAERVARSAP